MFARRRSETAILCFFSAFAAKFESNGRTIYLGMPILHRRQTKRPIWAYSSFPIRMSELSRNLTTVASTFSRHTFASFAALTAAKVDLIEASDKGRRINPRRFDDLVEQIAGHPADAHIIVGAGSSAFVPLVHYVVTNEVPSILSQGGHQLVCSELHCAMLATI